MEIKTHRPLFDPYARRRGVAQASTRKSSASRSGRGRRSTSRLCWLYNGEPPADLDHAGRQLRHRARDGCRPRQSAGAHRLHGRHRSGHAARAARVRWTTSRWPVTGRAGMLERCRRSNVSYFERDGAGAGSASGVHQGSERRHHRAQLPGIRGAASAGAPPPDCHRLSRALSAEVVGQYRGACTHARRGACRVRAPLCRGSRSALPLADRAAPLPRRVDPRAQRIRPDARCCSRGASADPSCPGSR